MKGSDTLVQEQVDNPGGGPPDCGTVIGAEARGRVATCQGSRQRTSKSAQKGEGTPKRMCMTEVEKLKTNLHEPKK